MRITISLLCAATLLVLSVAPAPAQLAHDGGPPSGMPGWDVWGENRAATGFLLGSATHFDAIRFWGIRTDDLGGGYVPSIFWQILADDGAGLPGAALASGTGTASLSLRAGSAFAGFYSWRFDVLVGPQLLGPGFYWLALQDLTDGSGLIWETSLAGSGSGFAVGLSTEPNVWAEGGPENLAFALRQTGAGSVVPEPASLILLGSGLAGLGALRRRRAAATIPRHERSPSTLDLP